MEVVIRIVAGILLLAHGLVHLLYLVPEADDPGYPFNLDSSWLLPASARRPVALVLLAATLAGFALLALAVWGVPGLSSNWPLLAILAASLSLALLAAFWDVRLIVGVLIDVAIIVVAVIQPEWTERI